MKHIKRLSVILLALCLCVGLMTVTASAESGNKTRVLTVKARAALNGRQYRCKITDAKGRVIYTTVAKLTVK